jgi:hypothetical protein
MKEVSGRQKFGPEYPRKLERRRGSRQRGDRPSRSAAPWSARCGTILSKTCCAAMEEAFRIINRQTEKLESAAMRTILSDVPHNRESYDNNRIRSARAASPKGTANAPVQICRSGDRLLRLRSFAAWRTVTEACPAFIAKPRRLRFPRV